MLLPKLTLTAPLASNFVVIRESSEIELSKRSLWSNNSVGCLLSVLFLAN